MASIACSLLLMLLLLGLSLARQPMKERSLLSSMRDLFNGRGASSSAAAAADKRDLIDFVGNRAKVSQNGITCSDASRAYISNLVDKLEVANPTRRPAYSAANDGYWRLLYTDFLPAAPSSGKLGPFVGDVFQRIDSQGNPPSIENILRIAIPPIGGRLRADPRIVSENKWEITFDFVQNDLFGIALPPIKFKTLERRTWKIAYLDEDLKVIRAYNSAFREEDVTPFIFVLRREPQ